MKLVKLVANLGYGSRREVHAMCEAGRITDAAGKVLDGDDDVEHAVVRFDGEPLDPPAGLVLMMNKPLGVTCSHREAGGVVYDLLPERFRRRLPAISTVGRLDRDTSGLLLLTDDGTLLHRIVSPKANVHKVYDAVLARDLIGDEGKVFASGKLVLQSETQALEPAELRVTGPRTAQLVLREGRYHQVRRMFAAVGNHVESLHRSQVGALTLGDLAAGHWRALGAEELQAVLAR